VIEMSGKRRFEFFLKVSGNSAKTYDYSYDPWAAPAKSQRASAPSSVNATVTYIGTEGFETYVTKRLSGYCEPLRLS